MISTEEAYEKIKENSEELVISLIEYPDCYWGVSDRYISVYKESGEVKIYWDYVEMLAQILEEEEGQKEKAVFCERIFTDFLAEYDKDPSEANLVRLYACASYQLFRGQKADGEALEEDERRILSSWTDIEKKLYADICDIIAQDKDIVYPPCVRNKGDDPFYRIKPFMIRNGWTDGSRERIWERA